MTPARYAQCLFALRWTSGAVATWCDYSRQAGDRWANGTAAVPPQVAAWLERRMAGHLDDPPSRP